jgi:hypothetical protein
MWGESLSKFAETLRAHPQFPEAAHRMVSELVAWRKQLGVNNRVVANWGRESIIEHLLFLYCAGGDDQENGAAFERLVALSEAREHFGARAVRTALRLMQIGGFVVATRSRRDRRLRMFQPTPALIAHAREYYLIEFGVLDALAPGAGVRARLDADPDFLNDVLARAGAAFLSQAFTPRPVDSAFAQLLHLDGASAILAFIVDRHCGRRPLPPPAQLGQMFQISSSQTRVILKAAADKALIALGPRGRLIDASPLVDAYFDNASRRLAFFARHGFDLEPRLTEIA